MWLLEEGPEEDGEVGAEEGEEEAAGVGEAAKVRSTRAELSGKTACSGRPYGRAIQHVAARGALLRGALGRCVVDRPEQGERARAWPLARLAAAAG